MIADLSKELKELEVTLPKNPLPRYSAIYLRKTADFDRNSRLYKTAIVYHKHHQKIVALKSTINRLYTRVYLHGKGDLYLEPNVVYVSDIQMEADTGVLNEASVGGDTKDEFENLMDVAGTTPEIASAVDFLATDVGLQNVLHLDEFFERPIEIAGFDVAVGSDIDYTVEIWDAITSAPSIRAKLRNYAFLQADIEVRVAIAGTPFHMSQVIVSYQPFANDNVNLTYMDLLLGGPRRFVALSYLSQSPHMGEMDVRENEPLDLECPYINTQPMIRLFNPNGLTLPAGSPYLDAEHLGKLYIQSINPIAAATPTPSDISVFVYAKLKNVKLGCITGTVIDVTTESELCVYDDIQMESDERETGPIERWSTRAAIGLGWLSNIPYISTLATAGASIASGLGQAAAWMGWSYPTMNNEPMRVRNTPYQNGANVIGYDLGKRITLDPKQELTTDPRVTACDTDDMSIAAMCQRKSLIDTFSWLDGDPPLSTPIFVCPVNPRIMQRFLNGLGTQWLWQPSGLSNASAPFAFWRGDITFHFNIVCSQYHRGKIAFIFEPNVSQSVLIDTSLDLNKQFMTVIDIQEAQCGVFKVKWAFPKAWARVMTTEQLKIADIGTAASVHSGLAEYANGYIAAIPFTSLQSPDGSDVQVNVWIESDNMAFNLMNESLLTNMVRPTTEGFAEIKDDIDMESDLCKDSAMVTDLNSSTATMDSIAEYHFGELPLSFRALCKRFQSPVSEYTTADTAGALVRIPLIPPAFEPWTPPPGALNAPNLLGYLRYSFLGMRGGMKHRLSAEGDFIMAPLAGAVVTLDGPTTVRQWYNVAAPTPGFNRAKMNGTIIEIPDTNGSIEWGTPMYTNNLLGLSFADDPFPDSNANFDAYMLNSCTVNVEWSNPLGSTIAFTSSIAIAEDFTLMKFMGGALYATGL